MPRECREPKLRTIFKENFKRIGVSDPDFLEAATAIVFKSPSPRIQWVGLYWEGPISGALLAFDCRGKLLSTQRTRGILSLKFFNAPSSVGPAIVVEEVATGTGLYDVEYAIYSLTQGRIARLWSHARLVRDFALPSEDGRVESYEFIPSGPGGPPWRRISVGGHPKDLPCGQQGFFRLLGREDAD